MFVGVLGDGVGAGVDVCGCWVCLFGMDLWKYRWSLCKCGIGL